MSMGFCHLFSSYSELHRHSKVITYFFASSTLPEQCKYLFIEPTGYSFIRSLLVFYSARPHFFFFLFFFPYLRSQCLYRYFKEDMTIFWAHSHFSSYNCKSPDIFWNYCINEDTEIALSLLILITFCHNIHMSYFHLVSALSLHSLKGRLGKTTEQKCIQGFKILWNYIHFTKFFSHE